MATPEGLEPPTLGSEDQCSIQLSYGAAKGILQGSQRTRKHAEGKVGVRVSKVQATREMLALGNWRGCGVFVLIYEFEAAFTFRDRNASAGGD
jgi:hypothetical protein